MTRMNYDLFYVYFKSWNSRVAFLGSKKIKRLKNHPGKFFKNMLMLKSSWKLFGHFQVHDFRFSSCFSDTFLKKILKKLTKMCESPYPVNSFFLPWGLTLNISSVFHVLKICPHLQILSQNLLTFAQEVLLKTI